MKYFVLTTRGLEDFAKQEIESKLTGASIENTSYRKVVFSYDGDVQEILKLRSVEDAFFFIAELGDVGSTQDSLKPLVQEISKLDFYPAIEPISDLRNERVGEFSISYSSVGKRNFSYIEFKNALSGLLKNKLALGYEDDLHEIFDVRVFLEHENALVGVRLAKRPLHRRSYKIETTKATLQADIAYCMAMAADLSNGDTVLDPMCGSGTILIEASTFPPKIILGGDIKPDAVRIATKNVEVFDPQLNIKIKVWDATNLPLEEKSVDKIICNLPFGKQIEISNSIASFYVALVEEFSRVLKKEGLLVLLTNNQEELLAALHANNLQSQNQIEITINGEVSFMTTASFI